MGLTVSREGVIPWVRFTGFDGMYSSVTNPIGMGDVTPPRQVSWVPSLFLPIHQHHCCDCFPTVNFFCLSI
jgi:hypothetical protein